MSRSTAQVQRSWTASDEPKPQKWFAVAFLSLLLLVAILIFAIYSTWETRPRTFVTGLTFSEYTLGILPRPAYPSWDFESFQKAMPERGLESWQVLSEAKVTNRNEFTKRLEALGSELKGLEKKDTVVVYLRGHAINYRGKAFLLAGEFERKNLFTPTGDVANFLEDAISLEDIFRDLQKVNAAQVILLADICDLPNVPILGIVANDVADLIGKEMERANGNTPLWVIAAAASLQPNHFSKLKRKTLLQSASEYALHARHCENGKSFLSLAVYYESILRYSDIVTEGNQTPLLFRSGTAGPLKSPNAESWIAANAVSFARLDSNVKDLAKKVEDATKTTSTRPVKTLLVSKQDVAAPKSEIGKETPKDSSADAKKEEEKRAPETPLQKYWSLREDLGSRDSRISPQRWAPVDFAAEEWLTSGLEAARLERLIAIGDSQAELQVKDMLNGLEKLKESLQAQKEVGTNQSRLAQAWQAAVSKMKPESDKRAWQFPQDLPDSQRQEWEQTRANYHTYFDAMAQLSGWLSATLNEPALAPSVEGLVTALADLQSDLPTADDSLLDKRLPDNKVSAVRRALEKLKKDRQEQVTSTLKKLNSDKGNNRLSWADERSMLQFLQDTNLSYADRERIALTKLEPNQLNEPGTANNDDKKKDLTKVLSLADPRPSLSHIDNWCSLYNRALTLVSARKTSYSPRDSAEALNLWVHQLIKELEAAPAESDPTMSWKQACLNELQLFKSGPDSQAGMLLSVSKDTNIELSVPSYPLQLSSEGPRPLTCSVKRRNGTRITDFWLTWEILEPANYQGSNLSLLSIKLREEELLSGKPNQIRWSPDSGGEVKLMLTSKENSKKFEQGVKIRIGIASNDRTQVTDGWQQAHVLLPNPDEIELYAKCLNPAAGDSGIIRSRSTEFGSVLSGLSAPAVNGQAKSRYELYLVNRSDQAKIVRAKLYAVPPRQTNGNGSISTKPTLPTQNDGPYFETTTAIELPRSSGGLNADGSPAGGVRLELDAVPASGGVKPVQQSIGEFGLVLVIEELEMVENQPRALKKDKTYQWIECAYANPFGKLVTIKPVAAKDAFNLQVVVAKENWSRWGLKELEIQPHLTDARGVELDSTPSNLSPLLLTPDKPEGWLTIAPKEPSLLGKPVLHIDIGGYPRAIAFDSPLKGEKDETRNAAQAFAKLLPSGAIFFSNKDAVKAFSSAPNTFIVPARELADAGGPIGAEINVNKLSMPFQLDFPIAGFKSAEFSLSPGNQKQEFRYDRKFFPTFEVEGGNLVFSAGVRDLTVELPLQGAGKVTAQAIITEASGTETQSSCYLILDKTPPQTATVVGSVSELYTDESVELSLEATDADSPVRFVFFAIDQSGVNEGKFDENDKIRLKADQFNGKWLKKLEASALEELPFGSYSIVARSIDAAGNVFDENRPFKLTWKGKRPVKAASKPAPKKEATAPPPKSEPQNVTVQVTVEGKAPTLFKNIKIKGLAGEAEIKNGTATTFTKVPEGAYDVTASYNDTFGTSFEGAKKVKVSADSPALVRIDLQRSK